MSTTTPAEAFQRVATANPTRDFLCIVPDTADRYGIDARVWSYGEALVEVESRRRAYAEAGLGLGQRAGLMLENRPEFFFHWLALNSLGVSVVPLSREWRSAELEYVIGHAELVAVAVPEERREEVRRAASVAGRQVAVASADLRDLACPTPRAHAPDGAAPVPLVHVSAPGGAPRPPSGPPARTAGALPDANTECALLYTSGTTGRPKGCVLPNEYFLNAGSWYLDIGGLAEIREDRLITPLPMSHMNAMAFSSMVMILSGGCIVPLDRFHPSTWWESVRASRATIVHYLGVMPAMLLGAPPSSEDKSHSVRFGFGAGVSPRLHAPFEQRFGFPLLEAWAMTETGAGAVVIANREPRKVGTACFGRASKALDYRVVDDEGKAVSECTPGELLVRSAGSDPRFGFFREYLKDPAATAEAWSGGYFHTGDIVQVDADGDFHFIDRKKNVIRRSGENISAVEVEATLLQHPQVLSAGVAGVPDDVRGDEVMACIQLRASISDESRATIANDVQSFCLQRLAYYKAPGYIVFVDQLPLTPTEKIQRARLKELAIQSVGAPGCFDLRALKKRPASV